MSAYNDQPLFNRTHPNPVDAETADLLNSLFYAAAVTSVSDIHFEKDGSESLVRYRQGNELKGVATVPQDVSTALHDKIRQRCKMSITDRYTPLDGRIMLRFNADTIGGLLPDAKHRITELYDEYKMDIIIDVRVSLQPTLYGESIVCRLLDQRNAGRRLADISMTDSIRQVILSIIEEPDGLFLITGPTGSGKTSTLYAVINELNNEFRKIVTIEDPVEYCVTGLNQINIKPPEITFPKALRNVLRQDPDVILVGEIRDAETAQIAFQAALTGHLVLATLHTNSAVESFTRLIGLGVDAFTLSSALRCVVAQRLVKKLADPCEFGFANDSERAWLLNHDVGALLDMEFAHPHSELGTTHGYNGRLPVMEAVVIDAALRKILPRNNEAEIRNAVKQQPQYETLAQAAARLSTLGLTSLAEAMRITSKQGGLSAHTRLGERLLEMGKLQPFQLEKALVRQKEISASGNHELIGNILVGMDYCLKEDIDAALNFQ